MGLLYSSFKMRGELLDDLNQEQRAAVTFGEGPLLVLAGVGTGKTTVITRRIAWLIAEKRATPAEILALTFTERAAAEMEERVDLLVPYGYIEAQIGTFHAFCDRLLRENAVRLGLSPDYRILTEPEQLIFLKDHLFELPLKRFRPLGNPVKHLRAVLTLFSRAKDEDVSPQEYLAYTETLARQTGGHADEEERRRLEEALGDHKELASVYETYQRLLVEHSCVDFGDLIAFALRLLREHPNVLKRYQDRFRYILVDEFQDTNYAQFELLKRLAGAGNLTVCGDDDQSIYKFRGAAISNILNFKETYPNADLIVLKENYRSTQPILDAAYRLIQHNNPDRLEEREGILKRLRAVKGDGPAIVQHHFERLAEECDFVAETIAARVKEEDLAYRDFAVLVRSNAQATPFLHALNLLHIPWHFSGSRGLYDREEVKTAIAFLRLLADPRDNLSFHYLARSDFYRVSAEDLTLATSFARRRNRSLFEVFRIASKRADFLGLSNEGRAAMTRLVDDLTAMLSRAAQAPTGEILYEYLTSRTDRIETLSNSGRAADNVRLQNLAKLFSIIERFSRVCRYDRVPWFIDYLDALIEAGDNPPVGEAEWDEDAVNVLTIHQAKGLEFPIVFLVGLVAGRFPAVDRRDPVPLPDPLVKDIVTTTDFHQQEERRLFYVGMTRAKEGLFLTSAQDYGGKRPRKPGLFVSEALDLPPAAIKVLKGSPIKTIARHGKPPAPQSEEKAEDLSLLPSEPVTLALSHQKIDDYLTCPKKYRYIHLLKVPIRQHHTVIYGYAIHQAIRHFHMSRLTGERLPLSDLEKLFRKAWRAEGFLTRQHEELRLNEGLAALAHFYAYESEETIIPAHVERHFSFAEGNVRVVGIFDRIDLSDGKGTIIDYKTSTVTDPGQAEKRCKASRQLAIYTLAYQRLFGELPARLELRFLTPEVVVGGYSPTEKVLERALSDIETAAAGIRAGRFEADPGYLACTYCPYRAICPDKRST
jgi:DNA helicase-2/ATP-dependent DNA helicase PcrA